MILSHIWDNGREKKNLGHFTNKSEYEKSCCLLWCGDIREIWTLWCPSELLQGGKRHQSMSSCSQGLLRGFLAVKPWPRVQSKSWKRRGKSLKVFSIYTSQGKGAPKTDCCWLGVPAASICVSWAFQADSWRHHRTYEISTRKVSQNRTSIFPANPVPLPGWHMGGMLCVASSNCEVTPSSNEFPKSLQQVSLVAQVGIHWSPAGAVIIRGWGSNFWLMKIIIMSRWWGGRGRCFHVSLNKEELRPYLNYALTLQCEMVMQN